jgi:hypothetical protein
MVRYTLLFILWSIVITPIKAQIEQCDIIKLKDAIVIGEYLPWVDHGVGSNDHFSR